MEFGNWLIPGIKVFLKTSRSYPPIKGTDIDFSPKVTRNEYGPEYPNPATGKHPTAFRLMPLQVNFFNQVRKPMVRDQLPVLQPAHQDARMRSPVLGEGDEL